MRLSELRIGNYINGLYETEVDRGNGVIEDVEVLETVRVVCIDSVGVTEYPIWVEDGSREEYDSFKGVPITGERLIGAGFEQDVNWKNRYNLNGFTIALINDPEEGFFNKWIANYEASLKCIHQVQNLYFSLRGEELIFKK